MSFCGQPDDWPRCFGCVQVGTGEGCKGGVVAIHCEFLVCWDCYVCWWEGRIPTGVQCHILAAAARLQALSWAMTVGVIARFIC